MDPPSQTGVSPLTDSLALLEDVNPDVHAKPDGATATHAEATPTEHVAPVEEAPAAAPASAPPAAAAAAAAAAVPVVAPEKAGWMQKNSYSSPALFNNYYFVLANNQLSYYVSEESSTPKGTIQLEGCSCEIVPESKFGLAQVVFELNSPLQGRVFALACDSQEVMQQWINAIRSCMLKIRRAKAKDVAARKKKAVEGAAAESQAAQQLHREQQQALAQAALAQQSAGTPSASNAYAQSYNDPSAASSSSATAASSSAASGQPAVSVHPSSGGAYTAGGPSGLPVSSEDKYTVYRQWLDETKTKKAGGPPRTGSMSGELHHTLLDEEQKQKSTFEKLCGCCPPWCFQ